MQPVARLGYLKHSLHSESKEAELLGYKNLVRPMLEYGCAIWSRYLKSDMKKLEVVNKKKLFDFFFLNIFSLAEWHRVESNKFCYTTVTIERCSSSEYLKFVTASTTRNFHRLNITPLYARTDKFQYSLFP